MEDPPPPTDSAPLPSSNAERDCNTLSQTPPPNGPQPASSNVPSSSTPGIQQPTMDITSTKQPPKHNSEQAGPNKRHRPPQAPMLHHAHLTPIMAQLHQHTTHLANIIQPGRSIMTNPHRARLAALPEFHKSLQPATPIGRKLDHP
ncbi:hypothetical protein PtA15_9A176 [Puccinia triticina]|uniref:Uncharacterized protein n=1 Tax=Puccinia triticina TaxID=208348 RepID=A0ABY7CS30_9BASI|nr:uncharacterized protein PtA15_9A176 [Puccinia triticina]WAQ88051.1 hypothetical protein PtA15_9A176 [Puccinia triticina]